MLAVKMSTDSVMSADNVGVGPWNFVVDHLQKNNRPVYLSIYSRKQFFCKGDAFHCQYQLCWIVLKVWYEAYNAVDKLAINNVHVCLQNVIYCLLYKLREYNGNKPTNFS